RKKKIPIEFRSLFIIDSIAMDAFPNRAYSCAACSKSFSSIKSLSDHEAQVHGERPCRLCGRGNYKNWKSLSNHLRGIHNRWKKKAEDGTIEWVYDSEPKKCKYCRKQFNTHLQRRVNHPDGPAMPKITTTTLKTDPRAPFPKVQWYYKVKVEGLLNHDFGTKFIDLCINLKQ
ncbi:MAG: hypothetical protein GY847_17090, partial [Proteobacteria bacterium]|nr:hypothetical protein [Pseudomonadota bacterium]